MKFNLPLPFLESLNQSGIPRCIPSFHRKLIMKRDVQVGKLVHFYLLMFLLLKLIIVIKKGSFGYEIQIKSYLLCRYSLPVNLFFIYSYFSLYYGGLRKSIHLYAMGLVYPSCSTYPFIEGSHRLQFSSFLTPPVSLLNCVCDKQVVSYFNIYVMDITL